MNCIEIKYWILGYLSALEKNDNISSKNISDLIEKFREVTENIESEENEDVNYQIFEQEEQEDDLPF